MIILRNKEFANVTTVNVLGSVKTNVAKNLQKATGLKSKKIAKELKRGAEALQDYTGHAKNSFIDSSGVGHNTISYARNSRPKGDPGKFTGDLFDGMDTTGGIRRGGKRQKPITPPTKPNTGKGPSILRKQHDLAAFNRKKDRGSKVMDIAGEEFKKVVKTDGTSRVKQIGPWLPGFNRV